MSLDDLSVHSIRTLIENLAIVVVNIICLPGTTVVTRLNMLQSRTFQLLNVNLDRIVPINMTQ